MLEHLRIRNLAVVDDLSISFEPGLNLLTGATGAGKSIIVGSLSLLLGERAGGDRVRGGESSALVEATFSGRSGPNGAEMDRLVAGREIKSNGRSNALLNGQSVAITRLRAAVGEHLFLHGQHAQQALTRTAVYLDLLDRFAGLDSRREALRACYRRLFNLDEELRRLQGDPDLLKTRRETLEFQLSELENSRVRAGEDDDLRRERELLRDSGKFLEACRFLSDALESDGGVSSTLHRMVNELQELAGVDERFRPYLERNREFLIHLGELERDLYDFRESLNWNPDRLSELESRLSNLHSLKSRYGGSLEAVLLRGEEIERELERLRDVDGAAERLHREREAVRAAFRKAAAEITRLRRVAAVRMEKRLLTELQALAFPNGTLVQLEVRQSPVAGSPFEVEGVPVGYGPLGWDWIDFRISSNPGEPARSLGQIASGGELSRVLLAVRSLASRQEPLGRTLIFDEVDAGVGADVATVVGERLRALSLGHQVICVSHWAQVAAAADCHFRVEKRVDRGRTHVSVRRLTGAERGKEIARMLGGRVTPRSSLRHARDLLTALGREQEAG